MPNDYPVTVTRWGYISEHILDIQHFTREEQLILVHLSILTNPDLKHNPIIIYSLLEKRLGYERSVITKRLNKLARKLEKINFPDCRIQLTKRRDDFSSKCIFDFFYEFEKVSIRKIQAAGSVSQSGLSTSAFSDLQISIVSELLDRGFANQLAINAVTKYSPEIILKSLTYHEQAKVKKPGQIFGAKHISACIANYEKWGISTCEEYNLTAKKRSKLIPFETALERIEKHKSAIPVTVRKILSNEDKIIFEDNDYNTQKFLRLISEPKKEKILKEYQSFMNVKHLNRNLEDYNNIQYWRAFLVFLYANNIDSAIHQNKYYDKTIL